MKNIDRIIQMNIYDLLVKLNNRKCIIESLTNVERARILKRCKRFDKCEKCIQAYLNEDEKDV